MLDKEKPEEVCGLQERVSALESDVDNLRLTLAELTRKIPYCNVCGICQKHSIAFYVFLPHVKPSLYAILFEFCQDLDYYLVSKPCGIYPIEFNLEMPARCILNIGGEYTIGPVTLGLNIHNLLGTRYNRSGMNTNLIPQQGRWFLGSIAVRL